MINTDSNSLPNETTIKRGILWWCCFCADCEVMWWNSAHLRRFGSRWQP